MSALPPDDFASPAEARVHGLLADLADVAAPPAPELAARVVRRARWQRPLRHVLDLTSGLAGAIGDGASLLVGRHRGDRR